MQALVVEDELKVANFVAKGLAEENFEVEIANDGKSGLDLAMKNEYSIIVLDLMLPEMDGLEVLRHLRADNNSTPVIVLTAKDETDDKVKGLDTGADDYLIKPFAFSELHARIRALLRRDSGLAVEKLQVANLLLDPVTRKVTRADKEIDLTQKEYALLEYFMRHAGTVLTRPHISEHVWGYNFDSFTNVIDVYVNFLRKKIDHGHENKLIQTVRGVGYVMKDSEAD